MKADLRLALVSLSAALALAGCQDKKPAPVQGTAGGEILPGSVSDAMLPVDTVRSQPPLAPKAEGGGDEADKPDPAGKHPADKPAPKAEAPPPAPEPPAAEPSDGQ